MSNPTSPSLGEKGLDSRYVSKAALRHCSTEILSYFFREIYRGAKKLTRAAALAEPPVAWCALLASGTVHPGLAPTLPSLSMAARAYRPNVTVTLSTASAVTVAIVSLLRKDVGN